jgi:hypothetical protein
LDWASFFYAREVFLRPAFDFGFVVFARFLFLPLADPAQTVFEDMTHMLDSASEACRSSLIQR